MDSLLLELSRRHMNSLNQKAVAQGYWDADLTRQMIPTIRALQNAGIIKLKDPPTAIAIRVQREQSSAKPYVPHFQMPFYRPSGGNSPQMRGVPEAKPSPPGIPPVRRPYGPSESDFRRSGADSLRNPTRHPGLPPAPTRLFGPSDGDFRRPSYGRKGTFRIRAY
jgi:hypothetical protein